MHRACRSGWTNVLTAAAIASALTTMPAVGAADARETEYLKFIVGADDLSRSGAARGVRIIEVLGSGSVRGGLRRGDVVVRLDGRRVRDRDALAEALEDLGNGSFSVEVLRLGRLWEVRLPGDRRLVSGDVILGDRRWVIRDMARDVRRDVIRDMAREVRRDVIRDVVRNVRRDVIRDLRRHRHRDVVVLRDHRAELRDSVDRLRRRLRELEWRLEAEGWR